MDPKRRDLYDSYGETGLKLIEDPQSLDPQTAFTNFMRSSSLDRCAIFLTILGVTAFVLLWPVLLCLQTDQKIHIPWTAIWTPLWVLDALLLFMFWFIALLGRQAPPEGLEEGWRDDWPARLLNAVQFTCNVLFQIFLTLKLDKDVGWDWSSVFAPWLAWEGIQLFRNLTIASSGGAPTPFATSNEERTLLRAMAVRQAMLSIQHGVLRIVFCALAILKLDEKIHVTWWVVFVPLWLFFGTQFLGICVEYSLARRLQDTLEAAASPVDPETGAGGELPPEEAMMREQAEVMASRASMLGCQASILLMMALLGVARIEGAHYSVFIIFLPVFILVGCFTCSLGCAVCCLRDPEMMMEGEMGEHRPLNPGAQASSTAGATSTTVAVAVAVAEASSTGTGAGAGGGNNNTNSPSTKTGPSSPARVVYQPPAPTTTTSDATPAAASSSTTEAASAAKEEIGGID